MGDYGKLDKQTREFNRKGNIYNDMHIYQDTKIAKLVKDHPSKEAPRKDVYIVTSVKVTCSNLEIWSCLWNLSQDWTYCMVCTFSEVPGLTEALIQGQWAFGSTHGVLLLMAHPCSSYILGDTFLNHLTKVQALNDMFIITKVFLYLAYSLYLLSGCECPSMLNLTLIFIVFDDQILPVSLQSFVAKPWVLASIPKFFILKSSINTWNILSIALGATVDM